MKRMNDRKEREDVIYTTYINKGRKEVLTNEPNDLVNAQLKLFKAGEDTSKRYR